MIDDELLAECRAENRTLRAKLQGALAGYETRGHELGELNTRLERAEEALAKAEAKYTKAASAYAGMCHTLGESGRKQQLAEETLEQVKRWWEMNRGRLGTNWPCIEDMDEIIEVIDEIIEDRKGQRDG